MDQVSNLKLLNLVKKTFLLLSASVLLTVILQYQTLKLIKPFVQLKMAAVYPSVNHSAVTERQRFGYTVVLQYEGQQTGAAGSLASLQCWIKSSGLPLHILEPMVHLSHFVTNSTPSNGALWFGDLFSRRDFNLASVGQQEHGRLKTWSDLVQHAPRNAVYVQIKDPSPHNQEEHETFRMNWEANESKSSCLAPEKLEFLKSYGFCVVRIVQLFPRGLNPWKKRIYFDGSELYSPFTAEHVEGVLMNGRSLQDVTIVFDQWLPMYFIPNINSSKKETCRNVHWTGRKLLYPSQQLLRDAEMYEALFLKPRTVLAILIRSEHLVTWVGRMRESQDNLKVMELTVHSYLKELTDRAKSIMRDRPDGKIFVTADVGKYGSLGWSTVFGRKRHYSGLQLPLLEAVKRTVCALYNYRWTFEDWEDSFDQVLSGKRMGQRGYVAALQRTIASRADCLVLLGGGSFGLVAIHEYARKHPHHSKQCVHFLGMPSWYRKIYEKALNSTRQNN